MFDDPKQRLYELEQALKAAEVQEQEEEDWLLETQALLDEPEELEEPDAVYAVKPKRKGALPYVILAFLELMGIGLVILWWLRWTI